MRTPHHYLIAATLPWLIAARAGAQERPGSAGSTYLQGGITIAYQPGETGESYQTYVAAAGDQTLGWMVAGGVFIRSGVSVEGELESTGLMSAREPSRYAMTFNEERRDRFLGVNLRFHVPANSRVHLEPLVGIAFVKHERWSQTEYGQFSPSPIPPPPIIGPRVRDDLSSRLGFTTGVDLRLGGQRVAVVPSFRFHLAGVGDDIERDYPGGFPSWSISSGVSARVDF